MSDHLLAHLDSLCPPSLEYLSTRVWPFAPCSGPIRCSGSAPGVKLTSAVHRGRLGRCGGALSGAIRSFIDDPLRRVSRVKVNNCFRSHISDQKLHFIFGQILHCGKWFFAHETPLPGTLLAGCGYYSGLAAFWLGR